MSKAAKPAKADTPPRRDYDRRKRKGAIRRSTGRPIWRQPLLLGRPAVMLLGTGGVGGWWAWKQGWLVEAQTQLDGQRATHAIRRSRSAACVIFQTTTRNGRMRRASILLRRAVAFVHGEGDPRSATST